MTLSVLSIKSRSKIKIKDQNKKTKKKIRQLIEYSDHFSAVVSTQNLVLVQLIIPGRPS
jgi:hypothetical protein